MKVVCPEVVAGQAHATTAAKTARPIRRPTHGFAVCLVVCRTFEEVTITRSRRAWASERADPRY